MPLIAEETLCEQYDWHGFSQSLTGCDAIENWDRRDDWWKTCGESSPENWTQLPVPLRALKDITSTPILNALIARSIIGGRSAESLASGNRADLYLSLIGDVHKREWAERRDIPRTIRDWEPFVSLMEHVAIACWHGTGRAASESEILNRLPKAQQKDFRELLTRSAPGSSGRDSDIEDIGSGLVEFYFAPFLQDGERWFDFTHKSFQEYLVARALLNAAVTNEALNEQEREQAWLAVAAGNGRPDMDLIALMRAEAGRRFADEADSLWSVASLDRVLEPVATLFRQHNADGWTDASMPQEAINAARSGYKSMAQWAANAELSLLAVVNAAIDATTPKGKARPHLRPLSLWPDGFGAWRLLSRQQAIHTDRTRMEPYHDITNRLFRSVHFSSPSYDQGGQGDDAGPSTSSGMAEQPGMVRPFLNLADLRGADLRGADLRGADLSDAKFALAKNAEYARFDAGVRAELNLPGPADGSPLAPR